MCCYVRVFYARLCESPSLSHFGPETVFMIDPTETSTDKIRVLIANSDVMGSQLMASALKRCRSQFEVVGLASTATEAISQLQTQNPNVALVSPELQDGPLTGFKVLHELRESHPQT